MSIKNEMKKMISSDEFKKMLGPKYKVIKYSDLENYNDLNSVIPESRGFIILLIETKYNTGHYVALLKNNSKSFSWFDSYALAPDTEFKFIPLKIQNILDESNHILTKLLNKLKNDGGKWDYNKIKFQEMKKDINTCGRYCCLLCYFFINGYTLTEFQNYMKDLKSKTKLNYDELITELTKVLN